MEEIQADPENIPPTDAVSILIGGQSVELLKENTPDLDKYSDPLKVLHNTLFPEDSKLGDNNFYNKTTPK